MQERDIIFNWLQEAANAPTPTTIRPGQPQRQINERRLTQEDAIEGISDLERETEFALRDLLAPFVAVIEGDASNFATAAMLLESMAKGILEKADALRKVAKRFGVRESAERTGRPLNEEFSRTAMRLVDSMVDRRNFAKLRQRLDKGQQAIAREIYGKLLDAIDPGANAEAALNKLVNLINNHERLPDDAVRNTMFKIADLLGIRSLESVQHDDDAITEEAGRPAQVNRRKPARPRNPVREAIRNATREERRRK